MTQPLIEGVTPLKDKIFVNIFDKGERMSDSGLVIIPDDDFTERGVRPRQALVLACGPDVHPEDVKPGDVIILPHGEWTRKLMDVVDINGVDREVAMTTVDKILTVIEE